MIGDKLRGYLVLSSAVVVLALIVYFAWLWPWWVGVPTLTLVSIMFLETFSSRRAKLGVHYDYDGMELPSAAKIKKLPGLRVGRDQNKVTDFSDWVRTSIESLKPGFMAIDAPDEMRVGVTESVTVSIGTGHQKAFIEELKKCSVHVEVIQTNTFMSVELRGDAFNISSFGDRNKLVTGDKPTLWKFAVEPQRRGTHNLEVHAMARFYVPNTSGQETYDLPVVTRAVVIRVNPLYSLRSYVINREKRVTWLIVVILIGLIGAVSQLDSVKAILNSGATAVITFLKAHL
jgi:hypothetical protein